MTHDEFEKLSALVKKWEVYEYPYGYGDWRSGIEMGFRSASDELCELLVELEEASKNQ